MNPKSLPFVSLLALIFGTTLIVSRFSIGQFAPLTYVGLRIAIASLCHIAVYALSSRRVWPRDRAIWRHVPVLGVVGTAMPMTLIIASLQYQSSGITSLLLTAAPAFTVIMAHFLLPDEQLSARKAAGVVLAIGGAAALVLLGESGLPDVKEANPLGYAMVIGGILAASIATIYTRKYLRGYDTFDVASGRMWSALVFVLPLAYLITGLDLSQVETSGYAALLYAALIGTFGGMFLEVSIIQRFGATATAITANLIPIVALTGGWLFLGEEITPGMIAAMILIIGGVTIITRSEAEPLVEPIEP